MKISAQKAIKNHCKGCIYDPLAGGTWIEQVENCKIIKCELYDHRPLTAKTKRLNRENYLASLPQAEREIELKRAEESRKRMIDLRVYGGNV